MKKIVLLILVISIGFSLNAQEPKLKMYKNRIGFEVLRLKSHSLAINYERNISQTLSVKLLTQIVYDAKGQSYTKGFVEDIALKIYGMKEKQIFDIGMSAYFMPYMHFSSFDIISVFRIYSPYDYDYYDKKYPRSFMGYGGGILAGFSNTFWDKIVLDIYVGGGLQANNAPYNPYLEDGYHIENSEDMFGNSSTNWEKKGIVPRGGFEISFIF